MRIFINNEEIYLHIIDKICKESSIDEEKFLIPCEEEFLLEFYSLKEINYFYEGEKQEIPLEEALEEIKFTVSRIQ